MGHLSLRLQECAGIKVVRPVSGWNSFFFFFFFNLPALGLGCGMQGLVP